MQVMNTHRTPVLPLLPFTALLAFASAGPGPVLAAEGILASLQAQGYTVVGNTEIDSSYDDEGLLFEGCAVGKEVPLANRQIFVCDEDYLIDPEFEPDAVILRHPATGVTRLLVMAHAYAGSLQGTAAPAPVTAALPGPTPAPVAGSARAPTHAPTPVMPPVSIPAPVGLPPAPAPGPRPMPPRFAPPATTAGQPVTAAPPPTNIQLIAPVAGTWQTSATLGGAKVEGLAMLNPDGTFNRFERWDFGLTVQVWGTYSVAAIAPNRFQLSQKPTGWDPKEWCGMGNVCQPLSYPASAVQFTFIDANQVRDDQTQVVYARHVQ
jgi:hypothetical protein